MELISEIVRARSMCRVKLEGGNQYWLRAADLLDAGYAAGQEINPEEFERFVLLHQYPRALNEAVAMLARRPCSQDEIRQKLVSHRYMTETIEMVLYKLEREKLLNDQEFSEQWVRSRAAQKYGKYRIYQELKHKGVSEEAARAALEQLDEAETCGQALELALRAYRRQKPTDDPGKQRQKVIQALVRRGYDWDTAREACRQAQLEIGQTDSDGIEDE